MSTHKSQALAKHEERKLCKKIYMLWLSFVFEPIIFIKYQRPLAHTFKASTKSGFATVEEEMNISSFSLRCRLLDDSVLLHRSTRKQSSRRLGRNPWKFLACKNEFREKVRFDYNSKDINCFSEEKANLAIFFLRVWKFVRGENAGINIEKNLFTFDIPLVL